MAKKKPETVTENQTSADAGSTTEGAETKAVKSIVPSKYAGKYKNGGSDVLAEFIKAQSVTEGVQGFSFPAFFSLARVNGLPEDKVAHYEAQVAEKRHGAEGRARMTLRNMLATIARKDGKLKGVDGNEYPVELPKLAVSGAAAKAQADASVETQAAAE